jgi:hypothetical protein
VTSGVGAEPTAQRARLQRIEERVELLDAEAPLAAGRAVDLQVAGV